MKDKYRLMTDEEMAEEQRLLEEWGEWFERWNPAVFPHTGGSRGEENDAFKL